jgi:hypothetical protein
MFRRAHGYHTPLCNGRPRVESSMGIVILHMSGLEHKRDMLRLSNSSIVILLSRVLCGSHIGVSSMGSLKCHTSTASRQSRGELPCLLRWKSRAVRFLLIVVTGLARSQCRSENKGRSIPKIPAPSHRVSSRHAPQSGVAYRWAGLVDIVTHITTTGSQYAYFRCEVAHNMPWEEPDGRQGI